MDVPGLRVVGLTGGIASGKTTVARLFDEWGAFVVDADRVARDVMTPGQPAFTQVVLHFGKQVLDTDGKIDRVALGKLVFDNTEQRKALEEILHPTIREESRQRFERCAAENCAAVGVYEAALLVETGTCHEFDCLIVVACSAETQLERLVQRDGLTVQEASQRLAAQYPLQKKIELAHHVIDSSGSREQTRERARRVWDALLTD